MSTATAAEATPPNECRGYVSINSISGVVPFPGTRRGGAAVKILVADDDGVSRIVLERTLSGWGHEVVTAVNGQEAWDALKSQTAPSWPWSTG